ncbi:MAG: hypothetical protein JO257_30110 [Deltaproteobacteria bacterium]|nr:hypothetical protein [Deltaproteobacteria bacterium]
MRAHAAALDLEALPRVLSAPARTAIRSGLRALLQFHRRLGRIPPVRAPRATPIVAVYEAGVLRGCAVWRGGGTGGERLARAFLGATASLDAGADLAAQAFYPRSVRWLHDPAELEVGTEGVALVRRGMPPVLLMPQVARDHVVDAHGLVALLAAKAGLATPPGARATFGPGARLMAWTVETVVARADDIEGASQRAATRTGADAADYAAAWLARMIDARGRVAFALDARTRTLQPTGPLWHARSAIAIEALAAHGGYVPTVSRARRWLAAEIERALAGGRVEEWPDDRATVLGTLALACLAGVPVEHRLRALAAEWRSLVRSPAWPWHAGQVACALGRDTPRELWSWCVEDLARHPFAPYTALAARACADQAAVRRATGALVPFLRHAAPYRGGATATALPETALTAVAAHALVGCAGSRADRAVADALAFVGARQLLPDRIPAPLDPALALGAFGATPADDLLRADITGHALLAVLARSAV